MSWQREGERDKRPTTGVVKTNGWPDGTSDNLISDHLTLQTF